MAIRRRWCISLAGLAIAAVPAATMAAGGAAATAAAAPAAHINTAAHITITHGPAVRNGGVALRVASPGGTARSAHGVSRADATSTNWSGYAATGGTYSSVSATWVQPAVKCSSGNQYSSFWVGLDGYNSNSVEQTGTDSDCSGSTPQYYGWYEMYPHPSYSFGSSVSPGDTISASVTFSGTNSYKLTLADETKGWSTSTTKKLNNAARSSAEVIIEAPYSGGILPLADFGTVNFSNSLVDGSAIGNYSPVSIDMVNNSGADKDTVSSLSGGENFSGTWVSSN
ncbi:MAG TPA: G1 family glutamic endopeptidase [Trebonia sp.]